METSVKAFIAKPNSIGAVGVQWHYSDLDSFQKNLNKLSLVKNCSAFFSKGSDVSVTVQYKEDSRFVSDEFVLHNGDYLMQFEKMSKLIVVTTDIVELFLIPHYPATNETKSVGHINV